MTPQWKVYKTTLLSSLGELSDINFQKRIWLNIDNPNGLVTSFIEAANNVFDDALITEVLEANQIVFDRAVTQALLELHDATDAVNEFRSEEEIINDPLMEVVRQKAAEVLRLIEASDGHESTVEMIE